MRRIHDNQKPERTSSWAPVYALLAGVVGLLYLERRASMTHVDHAVAVLAIVLLFVMAVSGWLEV